MTAKKSATGSVTGKTLAAALESVVGAANVVTDAASLDRYTYDLLRGARGGPEIAPVTPIAVVRPASTDEVAATVTLAAAAKVPVVALGGGTGLMGGARSVVRCMVLDLQRMNRVLEIAPRDFLVRAEAGAILAAVGAQLEPLGLIMGHDPWTYPIATVGGTISTDGLGYLGGKYGSMGQQVLGLTAVLADGSVVRTRAVPKSSTGPGLRHLFIGAEGTLGIITEAALRVFPRPERRLLAGYRFLGFDEGYRAIEAMLAAGIQPAMVDFGQTYRGERDGVRVVTPDGAPGLLYLAFDGLDPEVSALDRRSSALLVGRGAKRLPPSRAKQFWEERHVIAEQIRARRAGPAPAQTEQFPALLFDYIHVAVPASQALTFKGQCEALFTGNGISVAEWGLWHRPELFSVAFFRRVAVQSEADEFSRTADEALRLVQELGGSMEYVHGAGLRLAGLMEREHGRGMQLLRDLKEAMDPYHLLNPGKLGL